MWNAQLKCTMIFLFYQTACRLKFHWCSCSKSHDNLSFFLLFQSNYTPVVSFIIALTSYFHLVVNIQRYIYHVTEDEEIAISSWP